MYCYASGCISPCAVSYLAGWQPCDRSLSLDLTLYIHTEPAAPLKEAHWPRNRVTEKTATGGGRWLGEKDGKPKKYLNYSHTSQKWPTQHISRAPLAFSLLCPNNSISNSVCKVNAKGRNIFKIKRLKNGQWTNAIWIPLWVKPTTQQPMFQI